MSWVTAANIAEVVTATSVLIAAGAYTYQRTQDRKKAALSEVKYFLDEIIPLVNEIGSLVSTKMPVGFIFPRLECIEYFSNDWIVATHERLQIAHEQVTFNSEQKEITDKFIPLLNRMEFFALHVSQNNTYDHDALLITQEAIVQTVEELAMTIMTMLVTRDNMYPNLRKLYSRWYRRVDRKTLEQRKKLFEESLKIGSVGDIDDLSTRN